MKRWLKALLGVLLYHSGLYRWVRANTAVIVLFHRVDDRLAGNPISCTQAEFGAFTAFFKRFFTVVSLGALLDKLQRGESVGGHLVITFDDGYLDNHETAAPELRRQELPACFFIATEFIGSSKVPWWDEELGIRPQWMTWDQVRSLGAQGFELGAHTRNHVDLGVVAGAEAVEEIEGSKQRLEKELGREIRFFSYPYGRIHQISEANREAVRRAGFACCVSAYGGLVEPSDDAFRIRRVPISPWFASPYQFGFEILGNTGSGTATSTSAVS